MKRLAILAMAVVAFTASAAFSQAVVQPAPSDANALLDSIRPALQDLATAVVTALAAAAALYIKKKWGIDLSNFRQSTFQLAATNAAGLYKSTGDMSRAVDYLKDAAPDAIEHFNIPDYKLSEKIEAKAGIIEAAGGVIPVMPGVVEQKLTGR